MIIKAVLGKSTFVVFAIISLFFMTTACSETNDCDDADDDGVCDVDDDCPEDKNKTEPGECGCGEVEAADCPGDILIPLPDTSEDTGEEDTGEEDTGEEDTGEEDTGEEEDLCPDDPDKTEPGLCGCGEEDLDSDSDDICDADDTCPNDPDNDIDEDGICGDLENEGCENDSNPDCGVVACYPDVDTDGDGVCDLVDICAGFDDAVDADSDDLPDGCDTCPNDANNDEDSDGMCAGDDPCPTDSNPACGSACYPDMDSDGDGICDGSELAGCVNDSNPDCGGPCYPEFDSDGDGLCDAVDACPGFNDENNADGDIYPDDCDACPLDADNDIDGDGICGDVENEGCENDPSPDCGVSACYPDTDTDLDGVCDAADACPGFNDNLDSDGDMIADGCDTCPNDANNDEDDDGFCADEEVCDTDPNKQDPGVCNCGVSDVDGDADGLADLCEDPCVDNFDNNCCQSAADCLGSEFCEIEDGTCGVDGLCVTLPMECGETAMPVCGCDGATYFTECEADYAEAAVESTDVCTAAVGCIDNTDCDSGEFCFDDGYCMVIPELCPAAGTEVCGFNATLYPNACLAAAAGVAVDPTGDSCPTVGVPCNYHSDCDEGDYCAGEGCSDDLGTCDPYFDSGTCTPKRDDRDCILEPIAPTCGCNAVFYLNPCGAEAAGARFAYSGICSPVACAALPDGVTGDDSLCPCDHKCVAAALGTWQCLPNQS